MLTRADLLRALRRPAERPRRRLAVGRRDRAGFGWRRVTARELMTAPARTVAPGATVAGAARLMHRAGVKRLLVTDHRRRLLGIVTAADLLRTFGRSDEDVRAGVRAALRPLTAVRARVDVHDGVVTVTGRVRDRATTALLPGLARAVAGVTDVVTDVTVEAPPVRPAGGPAGTAGRRRRELDGWWVTRPHGRTTVAEASPTV
ncbi:hypothetical protein GCM10020358_35610 [Amorphoplanes nipponensis]|uniref:CBS domain-containing protein n=1 Tax=Actinoplanes nipponensis TaxID=135950 RepID=A0A919JQT6_9ACTN|nr:hypothetical protein Ani05nite_71450 [Actinoplanes nipponensis]